MQQRNRYPQLAVLALAAVLAGCTAPGGVEPDRAERRDNRAADSGTSRPAGTSDDSDTGQATVSWIAPVRREDGECLRDLDGFLVKWGPLRNRLDNQVRLSPAQANCRKTGEKTACGPELACRYTIENLEPIKWYFTIQAIDDKETLGAPSKPVFLNVD